MPPRVTQGQLELQVGGADQLLQLADKDRTGGLADATAQRFILGVLNSGYNEVQSYIGGAVDLEDPKVQSAPLLVSYELAVDAYMAWLRGAGGTAIPKEIADEYTRTMDELEKIRNRRKGIGLAAKPTTSQDVKEIVKSDTEPFFNQRSPRRRFDGWS